jgi:hypothetical protein
MCAHPSWPVRAAALMVLVASIADAAGPQTEVPTSLEGLHDTAYHAIRVLREPSERARLRCDRSQSRRRALHSLGPQRLHHLGRNGRPARSHRRLSGASRSRSCLPKWFQHGLPRGARAHRGAAAGVSRQRHRGRRSGFTRDRAARSGYSSERLHSPTPQSGAHPPLGFGARTGAERSVHRVQR